MRGSVVKRGSTWSIVFDVGRDERGKRKQKWIGGYKTKKEAQAALAEQVTAVEQGSYVPPANQSVAEFLTDWGNQKKLQVRPSTWRSYEWTLNYHVMPHIGHLKLKQVTPKHIEKLYATLRESPRPDGKPGNLSERTILHVHLILQNAFDRAVRWGLIGRNPCKLVDAPRPKKVEMKVWTKEQVQKFIKTSSEDSLYHVFLLLLTTGMRVGEVLGLRWQDVDLDNARLTVRQQISFIRGGHVFQQPKTKSGNRTIPIPQQVVHVLKQVKRDQEEKQRLFGDDYRMDLDLVCCTDKGTPLYHGNFTARWNALIEKAGVPRIRIHDARHTHASLLLQQGINPKVVAERLGHANVSITLDTYTHLLPGIQERAVDTFANEIFGND
ncbi:site-specific integrase [Alicyclobacillus contaminans]|uniref:site-specific integrase n=1 Tax=Alicyclobacillus contaminans TaxID=392016 RepID=UPI0004084FC1|nr:site-specific integrase [Alicyclobacillus contaminans]GMA50722.1 site-specific integrase [Alicyclobacillus contaminans]